MHNGLIHQTSAANPHKNSQLDKKIKKNDIIGIIIKKIFQSMIINNNFLIKLDIKK